MESFILRRESDKKYTVQKGNYPLFPFFVFFLFFFFGNSIKITIFAIVSNLKIVEP